jgi:hypothetical protein
MERGGGFTRCWQNALLPAERCWRQWSGYHMSEVAARFDCIFRTAPSSGAVQYRFACGVAWAEGLADVFYDCPPVKEFRKRYANLARMGGKILSQRCSRPTSNLETNPISRFLSSDALTNGGSQANMSFPRFLRKRYATGSYHRNSWSTGTACCTWQLRD